VLWMGCIGEIYRVIFAFVCIDMLIFFEKDLLFDGVLFAGDIRRLLVGKPKAIQQIRNAAEQVAYSVLFMDIGNDQFGVEENMFFEIYIKFAYLVLVEFRLYATIFVIQQRTKAALLITYEIVSRRLLIKEKNFNNLGC
jgi:hypothetical protein